MKRTVTSAADGGIVVAGLHLSPGLLALNPALRERLHPSSTNGEFAPRSRDTNNKVAAALDAQNPTTPLTHDPSTEAPLPVAAPNHHTKQALARAWTTPDDEALLAMYAHSTQEAMASALGRSVASVRSRCSRLGLNSKISPWTEAEIDQLRHAYEADCDNGIRLGALAEHLGRDKTNVCRKARDLGLTNQARRRTNEPRKDRRKFLTKEDLRAHLSERQKQYLQEHGHPRGAAGMKHTDEAKARMSEKLRRVWADPSSAHNSEAASQRRSDNMLKRIQEGKMLAGPMVYSRCASGSREDLGGRYFRSAWEANYARYLDLLKNQGKIQAWEYECKVFVFEKVNRGTRAYTPDFKVVALDGSHEWHEVKGWMDDKSRVRLERMAKFYPEEIVKVIGPEWFKGANRTLAYAIPGWERPKRKVTR